jgi:hypothetical protein
MKSTREFVQFRLKGISTGISAARHKRTLRDRKFGSPKPPMSRLAVGRAVIPTVHYKFPLLLQEPKVLAIS